MRSMYSTRVHARGFVLVLCDWREGLVTSRWREAVRAGVVKDNEVRVRSQLLLLLTYPCVHACRALSS